MDQALPESEVIFEFVRIGDVVKVSALHVATDVEVSLVGDPRAGQHGLRRLALRKLAYVLRNRQAAGQS
jgi:hypothetical protein